MILFFLYYWLVSWTVRIVLSTYIFPESIAELHTYPCQRAIFSINQPPALGIGMIPELSPLKLMENDWGTLISSSFSENAVDNGLQTTISRPFPVPDPVHSEYMTQSYG